MIVRPTAAVVAETDVDFRSHINGEVLTGVAGTWGWS